MLVDGDLVVWNNKLTLDDKKLAGRDLALLGELAHHHIPILHRIIITPHAFKSFLKENNLEVQIKHLLGSLNHERIDSISQIASYIRKIITRSEIKSTIYKPLYQLFEELDAKSVTLTAYYFKDGKIVGKENWVGLSGEAVVVEHIRIAYSHLFSPGYLRRQSIHTDNHHTFSICLSIEPEIGFDYTGEVRTFGSSKGEYEIEVHSILKLSYNKFSSKIEKGHIIDETKKNILSIREVSTLLEYAKNAHKALYLPHTLYFGKLRNEFLVTKVIPATDAVDYDNTYSKLKEMVTVHPGISIGRLKIVDENSKTELIATDEIVVLKKVDANMIDTIKKAKGVILQEDPHPDVRTLLKSFGIPTVIKKNKLLYSTGDVISLNATTGEIKRGSMLVS